MSEKHSITGRLAIDIDEDDLKAVVRYSPDAGGSEWDLQAVNRFIAEHKITNGIDRAELEQNINKLLASEDSFSFILAEGIPAEDAVAAKRVWAASVVPDEYKPDVETVLMTAGPPEILVSVTETLQREKTVVKKNLLGLGRQRTEKVVETVKVQKEVPAEILPDVIEAGWVDGGSFVAEIRSGTAGQPGKDIYGKPVPAASGADDFYLGRGISQKGGRYIADYSGILRRGWNWAEIIPLRGHSWSVELSRDKNTCLFQFKPGDRELSLPRAGTIIDKAVAAGCSEETLIPASKVRALMAASVMRKKPLVNAVLSTDDDASFEIKVSTDRLKAVLAMHKGRGRGRPLVLKQVGGAIKSSGLKGLNLKKIQEDILDFYGSSAADIEIPLSDGVAPVNAGAAELEWDLEFLPEDKSSEIRRRTLDSLQTITASVGSVVEYGPDKASAYAFVIDGQVIAGCKPEAGKKGKDVFGDVIEPEITDDESIILLENVSLKNGCLFSDSAGLLEYFDMEGKTALRVRNYRDAFCDVNVADDGMKAVLSGYPAEGGGLPPSLEDMNRLVHEAGIVKGLSPDALQTAVGMLRGGEFVRSLVIAEGQPPRNAGEYDLNFKIDLNADEAVSN